MSKAFEPELGQMIFGQPHKSFAVPEIAIAALAAIDTELSRAMCNIEQREYSSPFCNTGNEFECPEFKVEAYSWNEEYTQPFNFRWRGIEISWYKWFGRGTSSNIEITPNMASEMLESCLLAIREYEKSKDEDSVSE